MIHEACKRCKYCNDSLEFPCMLMQGTELRCNILKAYVKREKFKTMIKGAWIIWRKKKTFMMAAAIVKIAIKTLKNVVTYKLKKNIA